MSEAKKEAPIATNAVVYERSIAQAHTAKDPELPVSESREAGETEPTSTKTAVYERSIAYMRIQGVLNYLCQRVKRLG